MPGSEGENAGYDLLFGAHHYYDEGRVADEVIWPLVDVYYRGDFRDDSALSDEIEVRKTGVYFGEQFQASIHADHDLYDQEEDGTEVEGEIEVASVATLGVHTIVTDQRRDIVLHQVLDDEDESPEGFDRDELVAKIGVDYIFDSDGTLIIKSGYIVEDVTGQVTWAQLGDEPEGGPIDEFDSTSVLEAVPHIRLFEHDMRLLETGIYVLQATKAIKRALRAIKKTPNIVDEI